MPANLPADRPPFLPFALPEIGDEEIAEVVDTLKSGWVTTGPKAKRFEQDFAGFLGDATRGEALHCVAVNSATAGLHLALEALGIGPGDEVITTTHTFTATAEVVRYLGADVKLVDIDPATLNIDPAAVRGRDHAAHQGADAGALRRPGRRHASVAGHRPPPRPEGGGRRRARAAHHLRRRAGRHARQRRHRVQLLRQQDHHHRRGRHAGDARRGLGAARAHDASARHEPRRLRPLHRQGAELVLRGRGAGLQIQPHRHRRGARPAAAEEGARLPAAPRAPSRRSTTRPSPTCR